MDEKKQIKIESFIGNKENNISSTNTIDLYFTLDKPPKTFEIIEKPFPHIISQSTNLLDGWNNFGYDDNGRRECSQERLSVRNYVGCPQKNSEVKKCVKQSLSSSMLKVTSTAGLDHSLVAFPINLITAL